MITEAILNIFCFLPNLLLNNISPISLSIPENVYSGLDSIFNCLRFFISY